MSRLPYALLVLATAGALAISVPASAGPISILVTNNQGAGAGLPGDLALSDGSRVILPFQGQLTASTLTLNASSAGSMHFGAFTVEINGIQINHAFRTLQDQNWSFALSSQMLAAANQTGQVEVRFDFGGSYNALTFDSLQLNGQANATSVVPEPGTLVLLSLGLVGVATVVRRRRA